MKHSQKVHSIPKKLHHAIQHVRASLCNLNQELELYCNSKEDLHNNHEDVCDASGDEEGILAIRTCKSLEDRLIPINKTSQDVHVVDILNPKTPQKLYYTSFDYPSSSEHDTSSSSEEFLPPSCSTGTKSLALAPLSGQDSNILNMENNTVISPPSTTAGSRSCSPQPTKVSGQQQKPLKDFSVNVYKLPQSIIASSRNANAIDTVHQGILISGKTSEVHTADNLSSEDMGCTELSRASVVSDDQRNLKQETYMSKEEKHLLCEESIQVSAVSKNSCLEKSQDAADRLDCYAFSSDFDDPDPLPINRNEKEPQPQMLPPLKDCENKSIVPVSLPSSDNESNDNEPVHNKGSSYQKKISKQYKKNNTLSHSETECEENAQVENLTVTSNSRDTSKKRGKKIKSKEYVSSSCSENEANSKKPFSKKGSKHQRTGLQNVASSSSELEEFSLLHKGIQSENSDALQNAMHSNTSIISSCSEHEEIEKAACPKNSPKVHDNKISPTHAVSTSSTTTTVVTAKQITASPPKHSFTPKQRHSPQQAASSVSFARESENMTTKKLASVKKKLCMDDCSEAAKEDSDVKGHYKLRSKGILI